MLAEFASDLAAYLEEQRCTGGHLERLTRIQLGDTPPRAEDYPAVTVDWDDRLDYEDVGNGIRLSQVVAITLYTMSLEGELQSDIVHQQCLIERLAGGKFRGLLPALLRKRRGYVEQSGQPWQLRVTPQPRVAFRDGRKFSTLQTIEVTATALFNPSQFDL